LRRHCLLLSKLEPGHVSPDEPAVPGDPSCRTFFILEAEWQSQEYKAFMRGGLDKMLKAARKSSGGNQPRERLERPEPKVVNSRAPRGLWRNCYSQAWLQKLMPHQHHALQIIDEDYDFSLDCRVDDFD
ncbi:hypothetical protein C8Q76DRAFT_626546, partial [Earliella scabrosa]